MPLNSAKLETILHAPNPAAAAKFFRGASEADRKQLAPAVKAWSQRLDRNWRAQFDSKAAAQVQSEGAIADWLELMPVANLAALACLELKSIKSLHFANRPTPALVAEVLQDRRPDWLDEYAAHACGEDVHRWTHGNWQLVRQLVRDGLCRPPMLDTYVLGAINGIKPPFNLVDDLRRRDAGLPPLPQPELVNLLLAERDWLDSAFWRLFEIDGTSEVSLANGEKYSKGESWTTAIVELSRRGILSRERLLDASLAALNRDFIQFRAGWFSRFHEALSPTVEERETRLPVYFQLLGSSIPPTVTFALKAIQTLDKAKPIPGAQLAKHLESSLSARSKTAVTGALQLLDRAARREKEFVGTAARLATLALLHESPDIQEKAFDLLEKHGRTTDAELRAKVADLAGHVTPSLRKRLTPWMGETPVPTAKSKEKSLATIAPPPSRLDPSRALQPITDLNELILSASAMMESPDDPMEIERVLDGISRLGAERPAGFDKLTGPLRKRALKKRDDKQGTWPIHPELTRALAMLLLTWIDGHNGFTEDTTKLGCGQNQFSFLFRRLKALGDSVQQRASLPLLSMPTHAGGWIDPATLVNRWFAWQKAGLEPDIHEQVLALLRLAPENRQAALSNAEGVSGESGRALCFALGAAARTGKNAPLWLAAWRSRQPQGDLPEFDKVHPKLGPDAGEAARYEWQAKAKHQELGGSTYTSLELHLDRQPKRPEPVGDALLPVLMQGEWLSSVDDKKPLLRWAATLWPGQREAIFAQGMKLLAWAVNYADAHDRDTCAYLEPLAEPHTEMREMATLALALGMAAEDAALRGQAQEGLIAAIQDGRLDLPALAETMSKLLATGINKFARWAKTLREAARVSPWHTEQVAKLLTQSLRGDAARTPRDIHAILELLVELLAETGTSLTEPLTRQYVQGINAGGRTAKLAKKLLG